ncbi:MAG: biotin--[acetyl-CoA-carboxylase] ligase [Candidatus Binataceae bacterium]
MAGNPYQSIESGGPGRIGWRIHYFEELSSTQEVARELAEQGAAHGTVVIAEQQTGGRGRMGRAWHSPPGAGLYSTTILRPTLSIAQVARISIMAGVAAAEALETVAPGLVAVKWPNDVWLRGKKACGILAEAVTDRAGALTSVLLGIGINVNLAADEIPIELRDKATSVRAVLGRACDRVELAAALFSRLDSRYMEVGSGDFESIRAAFAARFALAGKRIAVVDATARQSGVALGIDEDGALLLETERGVRRILAGDVTVEGAYD